MRESEIIHRWLTQAELDALLAKAREEGRQEGAEEMKQIIAQKLCPHPNACDTYNCPAGPVLALSLGE